MLAASAGSAAVANQASSISRATSGLVSRRPITSTLASFQRRAPRRGGGVGAQRGAHAVHLVRGDRRTGARPAEQHAVVGRAVGHELADLPPDLAHCLVFVRRRADRDDLVTARLEVLAHGSR